MSRLLSQTLSFLLLITLAPAAGATGAGDLLVSDQYARHIVVVSAQTGKRSVLGSALLPLGPGTLALSRQGALYASCQDGIVRINPGTGEWSWLVTTAPNALSALTIDVDGAPLAIDGTGDGAVIRINPFSGALTTVLSGSAAFHPRGVAVLENGDLMLTSGASVYRYDRILRTRRLLATLTDLAGTTNLAYAPALHQLAVGGFSFLLDSGAIVILDSVTGARLGKSAGDTPGQISVAQDGGFVWGIGGARSGTGPPTARWTDPCRASNPAMTSIHIASRATRATR